MFLTQSLYLTSITLISGHVQLETTTTFGLFWFEKPHYTEFLLF